MRTSGRCPVSCAQAGVAVPGLGEPRSGVFRYRGRVPSARSSGFCRTGVRRRARCAAGCPVRPGMSRTGRPRCGGMTVIASQRPRSRSCLPDRPVDARGRAGPVAGRPRPGDRQHRLIRSHFLPPVPRPSAGYFHPGGPGRSLAQRSGRPDLIHAGTGLTPRAGRR